MTVRKRNGIESRHRKRPVSLKRAPFMDSK